MYYENVTGRLMLKIASIILLVIAGVSLLTILFASSFFSYEYHYELLEKLGYRQLDVLSVFLSVIQIIIYLIAGIAGLDFCRNRRNANLCVVLGVALIIFYVLSFMLIFISAPARDTENFFSNITSDLRGVLLPILYLIGAKNFRESIQGNM